MAMAQSFSFTPTLKASNPTHSALLTDDVDIQPPWKIPRKVAVTTAIVGAMHNKRFNPNHPMTPEEIYNSAREACLAGAPQYPSACSR